MTRRVRRPVARASAKKKRHPSLSDTFLSIFPRGNSLHVKFHAYITFLILHISIGGKFMFRLVDLYCQIRTTKQNSRLRTATWYKRVVSSLQRTNFLLKQHTVRLVCIKRREERSQHLNKPIKVLVELAVVCTLVRASVPKTVAATFAKVASCVATPGNTGRG